MIWQGFPGVGPENCEGFPLNIRMPETTGLDDGPNMPRLGL